MPVTSFRFEALGAPPGTAFQGSAYFDAAVPSQLRVYDGLAWLNLLSSVTPLAGDVTGTHGASVFGKVNGIALSGTPAIGYIPIAVNATAATYMAK